MGLINEFKEFSLKGNMVDLAIGVILGTAFGKVINSLVSDVIMPPIGLLLGGVDFSDLAIKLAIPIGSHTPVEIKYGLFINALISFFIVALAVFFVIKGMNRLRAHPPQTPTTRPCPECLSQVPLKAKRCCHCCSPL